MKKIAALFLLFSSLVFAEGFSWKTFDVKLTPYVAMFGGYDASSIGVGVQLVKPFSPYVGVGLLYEIGSAVTTSTDCDSYEFTDFTGGLLLNMNIPISQIFSLSSNYMINIIYRYGTVEYYSGGMSGTVVVQDKYGNKVEGYLQLEGGEKFYETESFQFRANLGFSVHTKDQRFGLEFYPLDIAVDKNVRHTFSLSGVVRIF